MDDARRIVGRLWSYGDAAEVITIVPGEDSWRPPVWTPVAGLERLSVEPSGETEMPGSSWDWQQKRWKDVGR